MSASNLFGVRERERLREGEKTKDNVPVNIGKRERNREVTCLTGFRLAILTVQIYFLYINGLC